MESPVFYSDKFDIANRAFWYGDAVKVSFYVQDFKLIMAEECYFYLMASMRKMRMRIPLSYTLEFFENLFRPALQEPYGIITLMAYRHFADDLAKAEVAFVWSLDFSPLYAPDFTYELDILKEISVNTGLLDGIRVHRAEHTYATIYAAENDLDDVILLNPAKRIARASQGNLLFLEDSDIRIPRQSEGAVISPLMENFVTYVHKNKLAQISEGEMNPFESQKAEEILLISDEKGIFHVSKIRNKLFGRYRFGQMLQGWRGHFS